MVSGGSWSPLVVRAPAPSASRNRVPPGKSMHCETQGYKRTARNMPYGQQWSLFGVCRSGPPFPDLFGENSSGKRKRRHGTAPSGDIGTFIVLENSGGGSLKSGQRQTDFAWRVCASCKSCAAGSGRTGEDGYPFGNASRRWAHFPSDQRSVMGHNGPAHVRDAATAGDPSSILCGAQDACPRRGRRWPVESASLG